MGVSQPTLRRHFQKPVFTEERYPIAVPQQNNLAMSRESQFGHSNSVGFIQREMHPQQLYPPTTGSHYDFMSQNNDGRKLQPIFPIGLSTKGQMFPG